MAIVTTQILDQTKLDVLDKTRANLFNWRGQFTPQFIEYLLDVYAVTTDLVLDPFCGSGTVLFESARKGIKAAGCEINPAAYAMAKFIALSNLPHRERVDLFDSVQHRINKLAGVYNDLPLFEPEQSFRDKHKNLLEFADDLFNVTDNKTDTLLALIILFHAESSGRGDLIPSIRKSCNAVKDNLFSLPHTNAKMSVKLCDARSSHRHFKGEADLIITSPPYINVFNYHQNYRAILEVLGFDLLKVAESEIGSNRKNRGNRFRTVVQYALDMEQSLASFALTLKKSGLLMLVVGYESRVRGIPFSNSAILRGLTLALGCFREESAHHRVFVNRFGQQIREDILLFRRTGDAPNEGNAHDIAEEHLKKALPLANGDPHEDIVDVLSDVRSITPSSLFCRKGII